MKHKLLALLLSCVMLFSLLPTVSATAAQDDMTRWGAAAEALWQDGLFLGSGTSFDLDKPLTRAAGVTMVVRLLGAEAEAKAGTWTTPFTDVPAWAAPYVGYAYTKGITQGTSATTFGTDAPMNAAQFLTLTLRALGYDDKVGDFSWDKATDKALEISLVAQADLTNDFLRGHAALVSYNALSQMFKGTDKTLKSTITVPGKPAGAMPSWTTVVSTGDAELDRAISYGFVPVEIQGNYDSTTTYSQLCTMLENLIAAVAPTKVGAWREQAKLAFVSNQPMNRDDGALALYYAARILGMDQFNYDDGDHLEDFVGGENWWNGVRFDYPLFPDWTQTDQEGSNAMQAAAGYVIHKLSKISGKPLLDYGADRLIRFGEPFTRAKAIAAVARLYESDPKLAFPAMQSLLKQNSESAKLLANADARRAAIRGSATAIVKSNVFTPGETYSGTAYYVSNSGSDGNNGLTPATAWATTERVNQAELKRGDAVFFERGGLWRSAHMVSMPGVTYSAYGVGDKPKLYTSPENGSGTNKWTLYYEGVDGAKIWTYSKPMTDCGALVMDGGATWAEKVYPFWDGSKFVVLKNYSEITGEIFDVKKQLTEDMTFYSPADSALPRTLPVYTDDNDRSLSSVGTLYLRCDKGNPGTLFGEIEFLTPDTLFDGLATDCVVDNLQLSYSGRTAVTTGLNNNVTVQNCEISWCGGHILSYVREQELATNGVGVQRAGGGIGFGGNNSRALNNYVHHVFQEGVAFETIQSEFTRTDTPIANMENNLAEGNLLEYCPQGILMCNWDSVADPNHQFVNCTVRNNMVLYSGYQKFGDNYDDTSFTWQGGPNLQTGVTVTGNVFAMGVRSVVFIDYLTDNLPTFQSNTYLQFAGEYIVAQANPHAHFASGQSEQTVRQLLNDQTGKILILGNP